MPDEEVAPMFAFYALTWLTATPAAVTAPVTPPTTAVVPDAWYRRGGASGTAAAVPGTGSVPGSSSGSTALSGAAAQFVALVNGLRQSAGLRPLSVDPTLTAIAATRAERLAATGTFTHTPPGLGSALAEEQAAGFSALGMGAENLAEAADVSRAFLDLAADPLHRENLLDPLFQSTGVAVVAIPGGVLVDELFAGPPLSPPWYALPTP